MAHWMDRRRFLVGTAATAGAIVVLPFGPASATPEAMAEAIKKVVGDAAVTEGRVTLDLPPLIENGNTVPLVVSVQSPMTVADHVKAIHVFNEKNPQPNVFSARRFWSASADVIVTLAACLEEST